MIQSDDVMDVQNMKGLTSFRFTKMEGRLRLV